MGPGTCRQVYSCRAVVGDGPCVFMTRGWTKLMKLCFGGVSNCSELLGCPYRPVSPMDGNPGTL